jgi:Arc/MetJ-type ribon-helix-helix transcriptional regulator
MTIHLPENLESSILEAVHSGQFSSVDDAMAAAARLLVQHIQQRHSAQSGDAAAGHVAQAEGEKSSEELQRRLFETGVISEIKPPITDLTTYRNRRAVPIQGEPLSETVIRERC